MEDLIRFLGIDLEARRNAEQFWPLIDYPLGAIIDNFYTDLQKSGIDFVLTDQTIHHLKIKQKEHWESLFASRFDKQYFNNASLVGIKHRELGLDPKWYIAGYAKIKGDIALIILESPLSPAVKLEFVKTLDKYVALDTALAISSYTSLLVD
jgi:methyl-accepting chemotaxis protein